MGAKLTDLNALYAAGIDPKTGLPLKYTNNTQISCLTKDQIKMQLRVLDEQNAVNRFKWYNLPDEIPAQLLERILYYRGKGMLFTLNGKFYFLPFALNGTIDCYGRYMGVSPLPFNGKTTTDKDPDSFLPGKIFNPIYDVVTPDEYIDKPIEELISMIEDSAVILYDYTPQMSQEIIARQILNDPILDLMAECYPFMRTALINSTGVLGMRVNTEGEAIKVDIANKQVNAAALMGNRYIPIEGSVDFQELSAGNVSKSQEFLLAMQSLDNYRLSLYGLGEGGIFQKKSHMLESEHEDNMGNVGLVMEDGLANRQRFATICNSLFGWNCWVEPNEVTIGTDINQDGIISSNTPNNEVVNNYNNEGDIE